MTELKKFSYKDKFSDYNKVGIVVDWTEKVWDYHLSKHPEIIDQTNTSKLISEAVSSPSLVLTGEKPGNKEYIICYYKEHKRDKSDVYYTKVVVGRKNRPYYVKTVFMRWALCVLAVQEKKYNFKELYRDPRTYL